MKLKRGDRVTLDIVDTAEKDQWFGRTRDNIGVFVRGQTAVGDVVEAEVFKSRKSHVYAHLIDVTTPSSFRQDPVCSHFGSCGGCKWQHIAYAEQRRLKHAMVVAALSRIGGFEQPDVDNAVAAEQVTGYRNKVEFSFSDSRFLTGDEIASGAETFAKPKTFALGFHAPRNFYKVVDIDWCHLATEATNTVLDCVKRFALKHKLPAYTVRNHTGFLRHLMVRHAARTGELMVNLVTATHDAGITADLLALLQAETDGGVHTFVNNITARKGDVSTGEREVVVYGSGQITELLAGCRFRISANSFFQTNTHQAEKLVAMVLEDVGSRADAVVYDLYCGAGSLSLPIAPHCRKLLGIDCVEAAISDAVGNASLNDVGNCQFEVANLNQAPDLMATFETFGLPDTVVTDPPRAGMNPKALSVVLRLRPSRIVYVSCNPVSLARDAGTLCRGGDYRLARVRPIDMFPYTNHIETVALLERTTT